MLFKPQSSHVGSEESRGASYLGKFGDNCQRKIQWVCSNAWRCNVLKIFHRCWIWKFCLYSNSSAFYPLAYPSDLASGSGRVNKMRFVMWFGWWSELERPRLNIHSEQNLKRRNERRSKTNTAMFSTQCRASHSGHIQCEYLDVVCFSLNAEIYCSHDVLTDARQASQSKIRRQIRREVLCRSTFGKQIWSESCALVASNTIWRSKNPIWCTSSWDKKCSASTNNRSLEIECRTFCHSNSFPNHESSFYKTRSRIPKVGPSCTLSVFSDLAWIRKQEAGIIVLKSAL